MANLEGGNGSGGSMVIRDYRKGNWSVSETMVLIEAKRMDDERRMKRSNDPNEARNKPAEPRWKWVEDYCWRRGCLRSQNQCNDKWDNLMRDYKKVREYERRISGGSSSSERSSRDRDGGGSGCHDLLLSYWKLEKNERKERNLPSNMLPQIYEALVEVVDRRPPPPAAAAAISNPNQTYALDIPQLPPPPPPPPPPSTVTTTSSGSLVHPYPSLPPLLQHPTEADPIMTALPLPLYPRQPPPPIRAQPPPPISLPYSQTPLPTVDSDKSEGQYSESPSKRRRRGGGGGGEGTSTAAGSSSEHEVAMGSAITRSAKTIAEAIKASEESEERRHRELLSMHERRLKIEESKVEVNRDGLHGLVDAINNLANSVLALASHNKTTRS